MDFLLGRNKMETENYVRDFDQTYGGIPTRTGIQKSEREFLLGRNGIANGLLSRFTEEKPTRTESKTERRAVGFFCLFREVRKK